MNQQIKNMVAQYMQLIKMVVKTKGEIGNKTAGTEIPDVLQVLNISYSEIVNYKMFVIKLKRNKKSIRIEDNSEARDDDY